MNLIPPSLYHTVFVIIMACLVIGESLYLTSMPTNHILQRGSSSSNLNKGLILTLFLILYFGFRDPFSEYFADTSGYAGRYFAIEQDGKSTIWYTLISESREFIWGQILLFFAFNKLGVSLWFTTVAAIYIGGLFISVHKLFPNNIYLGCLFAFLNFGFYSGAVNGIRNAAALSLVLVSLSIIVTIKKVNFISIILFIIGYFIHTSVALPILCIITSLYLIKNVSTSIKIWVASIVISIVAGDQVSSFFANIGFDNRLYEYLSGEGRFRWDFLLFSVVPIIWGWFVTKKFQVSDMAYNIIYNSYVLANSFWIMVIRAGYSNRFAMLSWFLYFLVIAYPLLKFKLYLNQGSRISFALIFLLLIMLVL